MRVISGKFRGRVINSIKSDTLRPTLGSTRQSVFNMINHRMNLNESRVMDVFCGTGAYGIEAASRGAMKVYFIDHNRTHLDLARNNLLAMEPEHPSHFICTDASTHLPAADAAADLILIDPPYQSGLIAKTLLELFKRQWIDTSTLIVIEEQKGASITFPSGFNLLKHKEYGIASIYLLAYQANL